MNIGEKKSADLSARANEKVKKRGERKRKENRKG